MPAPTGNLSSQASPHQPLWPLPQEGSLLPMPCSLRGSISRAGTAMTPSHTPLPSRAQAGHNCTATQLSAVTHMQYARHSGPFTSGGVPLPSFCGQSLVDRIGELACLLFGQQSGVGAGWQLHLGASLSWHLLPCDPQQAAWAL